MRVLSIDGGGIRGIIAATVLMALEEATSRRIAHLFDLIAGTSTGGILALASTCPQGAGLPKPASETRSLYVEHGDEIFPLGGHPTVGFNPKGSRTPLPPGATARQRFEHFMGYENIRKTFAPFGGDRHQGNARYPAGPLEALLHRELGDTMMSSALLPVAIISYDIEAGEPLVFRGGGLEQGTLGDTQMRHVARATSAGPTFFPSLIYTDSTGRSRRCVDGGVVANDPAFVAYSDAVRHLTTQGGNQSDILLVSIGTGLPSNGAASEAEDVPELVDRRTWLSLAGPLTKALSSGPAELMREHLDRMLGIRYVRLQTELGFGAVHAMDNAQPHNIAALVRTGEALVEDRAAEIRSLASLLMSG